MEEWKDIKNYEGLYQISNYGRVKSMANDKERKEKILSTVISSVIDGHFVVGLSKDGKSNNKKVHILVAEHFIPNPENKPCVHHIDHNKTNNRVDNLMWVTQKQHADLHPERYENAKNNLSMSVLQYTKDGQFVKEYKSIADAARQNGLFSTNISKCCKGKYKSTGGYIWRYKNMFS